MSESVHVEEKDRALAAQMLTTVVAASHTSTIEFAVAAIKGMLLLNGGSAVAVLSFIASSGATRQSDLTLPLALFAVGAVFSVLVAGISYISQGLTTSQTQFGIMHFFDRSPTEIAGFERCQRQAEHLRMAAIGFGLLSLILFCAGCLLAYAALKPVCPAY